jgi:hypothetical protein
LCNNQWNGKKNRNDQSLLHGKALQPPTQSCREYHCYQAHSTQTCPKKLQNVMAVTDVLALLWQSFAQLEKGTAMIAAILSLAFALVTGMALTTAFAFGLLPLF